MKKLFKNTAIALICIALAANLSGCGKSKKRKNPVSANIETSEDNNNKFSTWDENSQLRAAIENNEPRKAEKLAMTRINKNPKDARAYFFLAQSYLIRNMPNKAEKSLKVALELEPQKRSFRAELAKCHVQLADEAMSKGLPSEAINFLKKARENKYQPRQTEKKLAEAYLRTSEQLISEENLPEAESLLNEAINVIPDRPELRVKLASLLINSDRLMEAERILRKLSETNPKYEDALTLYAQLMYRTGEIDEAKGIVNKVLAFAPANPEALRLRSEFAQDVSSNQLVSIEDISLEDAREQIDILEKTGNFNQQKLLLQKLVAKYPQETWPLLKLSQILQKQGAINDALTTINNYLALDPESIEANFQKSRCLHQAGKLDEALNLLMEVEAKHAQKLDVLNEIGKVYAKMGKFDQARNTWNKILESDPEHAITLFNFGQLEMETGNTQKAQIYFEKAIHKEPFNPKFRYFTGINLIQSGLKAEALTLWESGKMYINPEDPYGKRILMALGENTDNASSDLSAAPPTLSSLQGSPETGTSIPAIDDANVGEAPEHPSYSQALEYARGGFFPEAIEGFKAVLNDEPENFNALMNLGKVYTALGKQALAGAQYLKALRIDPQNVFALRALATSYSELGLHSFAADITAQVANRSPQLLQGFPKYKVDSSQLRNSPRAFSPLAAAFIEAGLAQEALAVVQSGIREMPEQQSLYTIQGDIFRAQKDFERALVSYSTAIEKDQQNPLPYVKLGDLYAAGLQASQAVKEYKRALKASFIDADTMFMIVDRFNSLGREADAKRVLGRLKAMNLNQTQISKLEQHLGTTIIIEEPKEN